MVIASYYVVMTLTKKRIAVANKELDIYERARKKAEQARKEQALLAEQARKKAEQARKEQEFLAEKTDFLNRLHGQSIREVAGVPKNISFFNGLPKDNNDSQYGSYTVYRSSQ